MTDDFYRNLEGSDDFTELCNADAYRPAPLDWWLVITDVVQSTKAIEAGRYKEVNMVGAATLAALRNAVGHLEFPFVFGGDGASALIPNNHVEKVREELAGLKRLSFEGFGLELRTGMVTLEKLNELAGPVYVAKHFLAGEKPMAFFRGGALSTADKLFKEYPEKFDVPDLGEGFTDISDLSCRWRPILPSRDHILAVLVYQTEWNGDVLRRLLRSLDTIVAPGLKDANPVRVEGMTYRTLWDLLKMDRKAIKNWRDRLSRYKGSLIAYCLFRLGLLKAVPGMLDYRNSTPSHSDFRKYDDTLRFVIDCTQEQVDQVEALLKDMRAQEGICYGTHLSRNALMTCYVTSIEEGDHIHFIDGGDGGYALASIQLKAQLNNAKFE